MRCRHWLLTKNYQSSEILPNEQIIELINQSNDVKYYVFQLEKGKNKNTFHHQLFISYKNAKETETMIKKFDGFHIKEVTETPHKAAEYCKKEDSRITEPIEWGELPEQGRRKDLELIYDMLKDDVPDHVIREKFPVQYMRYYRNFSYIRQELLSERYKENFRKLDVTYIFGDPGTGKSWSVIKKHSYKNVFRITDKDHPFDTYLSQDVLVFEEFRSTYKMDEMLNYLDGYPMLLPARYNQKVACYTKVYLITNKSFSDQYTKKQEEDLETFKAFCRRINKIEHYQKIIIDGKERVEIIKYDGPIDYFRKTKLKKYVEESKEKFDSNKNPLKFVMPALESSWFDDDNYLEYYTSIENHHYLENLNIDIVKPNSSLAKAGYASSMSIDDLI